MTKTIDVDQLLDFQLANRIILKGVENHFDVITAHVGFIHSQLSSLFGPFIIQANNPDLKVTRQVVMEKMKSVLEHTLALCAACEYELPDEEDFQEFDEMTAYELKKDLILTLSDMMACSLDILHIVHLDMDGQAIWSEQEPPQDFVADILAIINGIKNIGSKYSFTVGDLITEI